MEIPSNEEESALINYVAVQFQASLHQDIISPPNPDVLTRLVENAEHEEFHPVLISAVQNLVGQLSDSSAGGGSSPFLVCPLNSDIDACTLGTWMAFITELIARLVGSSTKLALKYSLLEPLAAVVTWIPEKCPEFLVHFHSFVAGWRKRLLVDNKSVNLMIKALHCAPNWLPSLRAHIRAQKACDYLELREELLTAQKRFEQVPTEDTEESSALLPKYLMDLNINRETEKERWLNSNALRLVESCGIYDADESNPETSMTLSWWKEDFGKLVKDVDSLRSEIDTKIYPGVQKLRSTVTSDSELGSRYRGQMAALVRKEIKLRTELASNELAVEAAIDSRQEYVFSQLARLQRVLRCVENEQI